MVIQGQRLQVCTSSANLGYYRPLKLSGKAPKLAELPLVMDPVLVLLTAGFATKLQAATQPSGSQRYGYASLAASSSRDTFLRL